MFTKHLSIDVVKTIVHAFGSNLKFKRYIQLDRQGAERLKLKQDLASLCRRRKKGYRNQNFASTLHVYILVQNP